MSSPVRYSHDATFDSHLLESYPCFCRLLSNFFHVSKASHVWCVFLSICIDQGSLNCLEGLCLLVSPHQCPTLWDCIDTNCSPFNFPYSKHSHWSSLTEGYRLYYPQTKAYSTPSIANAFQEFYDAALGSLIDMLFIQRTTPHVLMCLALYFNLVWTVSWLCCFAHIPLTWNIDNVCKPLSIICQWMFQPPQW